MVGSEVPQSFTRAQARAAVSFTVAAPASNFCLTCFVNPAMSGINGFEFSPSGILTAKGQPAPIRKPTRIFAGARRWRRSVVLLYGQWLCRPEGTSDISFSIDLVTFIGRESALRRVLWRSFDVRQ